MDASSNFFGKFKSDDLRRKAEARVPGREVVVVEVTPAVSSPRVGKGAADVGWQRFDFQAFGVDAPNDQDVQRTRSAIEKITGSSPLNFFKSSGSFVVEADGKELKRIAELPSVKAIWPNR